MVEEPKTDENKTDWSRRHFDPTMRWAWNNATTVVPANKEKGDYQGSRHFPDGTMERFTVS